MPSTQLRRVSEAAVPDADEQTQRRLRQSVLSRDVVFQILKRDDIVPAVAVEIRDGGHVIDEHVGVRDDAREGHASLRPNVAGPGAQAGGESRHRKEPHVHVHTRLSSMLI